MHFSLSRRHIAEVLLNSAAIKHVDGLRAISILLVMIGHIGWIFPLRGIVSEHDVIGKISRIDGGYGVDMFFAISGFLIGKIIITMRQSGKFSLPLFYLYRFIRLAPAYYLTLLLLLLLPTLPLLTNDKGNLLYNFFI